MAPAWAEGPKDCLLAHALPGCEDAGCSAAVCNFKPDCCSITWDQDCVALAEENCSGCGLTSDSCFVDHAKPGCRDGSCCELVCADPDFAYCCSEDWDFGCSLRASAVCSVTPVPCGGSGAGSCVQAHGTPSCSDASCCENVCAVWSNCCELAWDSICVSMANQLCLHSCNPGCPDGALAESETCHSLTNDPVFSPGTVPGTPQTLPLGQSLCGALVATDAATPVNDVDVYAVNLAGLDTDGDGEVKVRLTLTAGVQSFVALVPPGSAAATLAATDTLRANSGGCQPGMDWACRTPGLWWAVVARGFDGVIESAPTDCAAARYVLKVEAEAACAPRCGVSPDSCFTPHAGSSCNDAACCASTCAVQPTCCDIGWDADCAITAAGACGAPAPANDACGSALSVGVGSTPFSLLGATPDGPAVTGCGTAATLGDIWFSFVPSASGETEISTCGTEFDTRLQVFRNGCGPAAVSPACNDDSRLCTPSGKASRLTVTVECGTEYLIRVGGVSGATGFGALIVGPPNGASCCRSDVDASGQIDFGDVALMMLDFGPCAGCATDLDDNGVVDQGDVALALLDFGPCS